MSILSRFRAQARYNVLTPVFLLALGTTSPALAANNFEVTAPAINVVLLEGDSLTNHSTITGAGSPAVVGNTNVNFIDNLYGATINGVANHGVYINGSINRISNAGFIMAAGGANGIHVIQHLGELNNSGTISANATAIRVLGGIDNLSNSGLISAAGKGVVVSGGIDTFNNASEISTVETAVHITGGVDSFNNSGTITSSDSTAVRIFGDVGSFVNSGTITGDETGVQIDGHAQNFSNTGLIASDGSYGVYISSVDTFVNSGTISSLQSSAISLGNDVGSFTNTGKIVADDIAVYVGGNVASFDNSSDIIGGSTAVYIYLQTTSFRNSGNIVSNYENGVLFHGDVGYVENSGAIKSLSTLPTDFDGMHFDASVTTIVNSGTISSTNDNAINIAVDLGELVNRKGGIITSDHDAIYVEGNAGRIVNYGQIISDDIGVNIVGELTELINSGTINANNSGLYVGGEAGRIVNSGTITAGYYGIYADLGVHEIVNSGTIDATYTGISVDTDLDILTNTGKIFSDDKGVEVGEDLGIFLNTGTISGSETAVEVGGSVRSFTNSGLLHSETAFGVSVGGNLDFFTNSGLISSESTAVKVVGNIKSFANSGRITSAFDYGVVTNGNLDFFTNSGLISSDSTGVYVVGYVGEFYNSGTITGYSGVRFDQGGAKLYNSGTIEGTTGNSVRFSGDNNKLYIGTGARFIGVVDFDGGDNSFLNAEDFHGSIYIGTDSLDMGNVQAGDNYYYQEPDFVLIVGGGFVNQSSQPVTNLASGLGDLLTSKLALGDANRSADDVVLSYTAKPQSAAEMATRDAMAPATGGTTYWADAIGGVGRNGEAETADAYGALVAGAHTQLTQDLTMGVMGGFAHTTLDIGSGSQTIKATVGIVGAYGSYDMGNLRTDFSVIGGLSGNDSSRTITSEVGDTVASASFGGWFIAPTVGAYLPVLSTETGEVSIGGRLGYLGGGFSGYTEDGSGADLTVNAQSYSVVTALLEVRGENAVSDTVTLNGSLGVFAQNQSGSAVAVSLPGIDEDLIGPGSFGGTSYGLKAGIGAEVAVSDAFNVNLGVTGTVRNNGATASANLGIGGKF